MKSRMSPKMVTKPGTTRSKQAKKAEKRKAQKKHLQDIGYITPIQDTQSRRSPSKKKPTRDIGLIPPMQFPDPEPASQSSKTETAAAKMLTGFDQHS